MKSKHQKILVFLKSYLKPIFTIWNMNICAHYWNHKLYLIIEMKTFTISLFYNGFCCYFKSICSSFDKVIKLFILSCLHPKPRTSLICIFFNTKIDIDPCIKKLYLKLGPNFMGKKNLTKTNTNPIKLSITKTKGSS